MPIPVKSIADFFVDDGAFNEFDTIAVARPDGRFFVGETDVASGPGVFSRRISADVSVIATRTHANNAAVVEE